MTGSPESSDSPNFAWSPDSARIALTRRVGGRDHVSVVDLGTAAIADIAEGSHPSWSPNGRQLARFKGGLVVRDLVTAEESQLTADPLSSPDSVWSPRGDWILFDRFVLDLSTGASAPLPARSVWGRSAWSPDGRSLVLGRSTDLLLYDATTRAVRTLVDATWGTDARLPAPGWSLDGRSVVAVDYDSEAGRRLAAWPVAGGSKQIIPLARNVVERLAGSIVWVAKDSRIVYSASERTYDGGELFVMREDGTEMRRLTDNRVPDLRPVWSPDGREIAFVRAARGVGEGLLFRMRADGKGARRVSRARVFAAAWSPNGNSFAVIARSTSEDPRVSVIDAKTGRARVLWARKSDCWLNSPYEFTGVAWSPNGRTIAFVDLDAASCRYVVRLIRADGRGGSTVITGGASKSGASAGLKHAVAPTWSQTGRLTYVTYSALSYRGGVELDVRSARADGSQPQVVVGDGGQLCDADRAAWAPEGDRFVWSVHACGEHYPTLRVVSADTGTATTIGYGTEPDWQPRRPR